MKTKIVTTALIVIGFVAPVQAQNSVAQRLENPPYPICNQIIADADARQQRQQDRQERLQQHQERLQQRQQERQERLQRQEQRQQDRQERLQSEQDNQQHPQPDYWQQSYPNTWWDQNPGQYNYPRSAVEDNREVPPATKRIKVDLISQTQDRVAVLIEGVNNKHELVFNENKTRQTIYLSPGNYKLQFNNDLGSSWTSLTLNLEKVNPVIITFHKDNPLVQVNDSCTANADGDCSK